MSGFLNTYQNFHTQDVANLQLALYTLKVIDPQRPTIPLPGGTYTFPLSPQSIRKSFVEMNSIYDVQGDYHQGGVNRIVDQYGYAPFMFHIEGTTGWKKHSTDGFRYTGLQKIHQLQKLLTQFAKYNQFNMNSNKKYLFELEWYDYYQNEYWVVIPYGEQVFRQDAAQPLFAYFSLTFAGIRPVSSPPTAPTAPDPISQMLSTVSSNVMQSLKGAASTIGGAYNEIAGVIPGL